jgi:hypothetical protein
LVRAHFHELKNALPMCATPNQILNMDELRLSERRIKGKKPKAESLKSCTVLPIFREERDIIHIFLAATLTHGSRLLIPLMLTTYDISFKSGDLAVFRRTFATYRTPSRCMAAASMMFCMKTIVAPYIGFVRLTWQNPALMVYFVLGDQSTHNTPDVIQEMAKLEVPPIWLTAHASHFLQSLKLTAFSAFKRHSTNTRTIITRLKIEGKIDRALSAWPINASIELIDNGWKADEQQVRGLLSDNAILQVNPDQITQLVCGNYPDGAVTADDREEEE